MPDVKLCKLTFEPLDPAESLAAVRNEVYGGIAVFLGDVRSVTNGHPTDKLFYEAYEEMALAQMRRIAEEAATRFHGDVAVSHRLGELLPGETAVITAAACSHRAEAFECCKFLIDRIKEDVPIWKKEPS